MQKLPAGNLQRAFKKCQKLLDLEENLSLGDTLTSSNS